MKTLGQKIKAIRLERGETLEEFGRHLTAQASDSLVSRWERGVNKPNKARLKKIAELGNTTVAELLKTHNYQLENVMADMELLIKDIENDSENALMRAKEILNQMNLLKGDN